MHAVCLLGARGTRRSPDTGHERSATAEPRYAARSAFGHAAEPAGCRCTADQSCAECERAERCCARSASSCDGDAAR